MINSQKHRVIKEIDKAITNGQVLHFLTGDGINDNFFYNFHDGIKNLPDTLRDYYVAGANNFDCFIHIFSASNDPVCYLREGKNISEVPFNDIIEPPKRSGSLRPRNRSQENSSENTAQAENTANQAAASGHSSINRLEEQLKKGAQRFFIFFENFDRITNLYDSQPDTTLIFKIMQWENLNNVMIVVTLKDMELLKKYNFNQKDIFIGCPTAEEIRSAYLRYLLKNATATYDLNMVELDEISHGMSVGEKTLRACMRILRKILVANPERLNREDFNESIEHGIEEKVSWDKVRLEQDKKNKIMEAVNAFLNSDEENKARHGMIFSGPPGTGKTLIAKSLASEKQCYFLAPTLAELKGEYIGQSSAKIKHLFDKARANEPTIIFIDEADTVFPSRALDTDRDSYSMDMVNQFLQEIDGAKTGLQKIFIIAATNRPESIDAAIKSRLGTPEEIPLPSKEMRRLIFEDNLSTKNFTFELKGKIFEDFLLKKSEKMSGRDIMNFVKRLKETAKRMNITIGDNRETLRLIEESFVQLEKFFLDETVARGIFTGSNIIPPNRNTKRLNDIIGYEEQKRQICWQAEYIEASEVRKNEYRKMKIEPQKGVLLYGPPGNGKSELAEAVAGEKGFYFFKILSKDFASSFAENQIKRLDDIFTEVERFSKLTEQKGIVLFFDEFDALAGVNNLNQVVRGSMLDYISDEKHLRGRDSKILFIAATNFIEMIDEAVKRKGRIDSHIFMDNPTESDGVKILQGFIDKENIVELRTENFLQTAYDRLVTEKRNNYLKDNFKTTEWRQVVRQDLHAAIEQEINAQRPSGADLKTFYRELKEIAFKNDFRTADKLIFDERVINRRFQN